MGPEPSEYQEMVCAKKGRSAESLALISEFYLLQKNLVTVPVLVQYRVPQNPTTQEESRRANGTGRLSFMQSQALSC